MVRINTLKTGFSLAEVLISMLILSVFFIATSKVISVKPKKEVQTFRHGYYECYMQNGNLYEKRADGSSTGGNPSLVRDCIFEPPGGIAYVLIYAINVDPSDGKSKFYSSVEPIFDETIRVAAAEDLPNNKYSIQHFQQYFDAPGNGTDISQGSENQYALHNYIRASYPSSTIYSLMTSPSGYNGPAVFFAW